MTGGLSCLLLVVLDRRDQWPPRGELTVETVLGPSHRPIVAATPAHHKDRRWPGHPHASAAAEMIVRARVGRCREPRPVC